MTAQEACEILSEELNLAVKTKDRNLIRKIRRLWDNEYSWKRIKEMAFREDSTWIVWWYDGVTRFYHNRKRWGYI